MCDEIEDGGGIGGDKEIEKLDEMMDGAGRSDVGDARDTDCMSDRKARFASSVSRGDCRRRRPEGPRRKIYLIAKLI